MSGAELDRRLSTTVAGTLESEPGLAVSSIGPVTGRPVLRGLGGDRILILEDGMRPGDMSSTSGDHAVAIDAVNAKRFEIVRGPMSLLYGSSALGGVVNVVSEEIPTSRTGQAHGTLTTQGETGNDSFTAGGFVTAGLGPLALRAEGSVRRSGDVATPVGDLVNTGARTFSGALGGATIGPWGHAGGLGLDGSRHEQGGQEEGCGWTHGNLSRGLRASERVDPIPGQTSSVSLECQPKVPASEIQ